MAAERQSNHPIAEALVKGIQQLEQENHDPISIVETPGAGISFSYGGQSYYAGRVRMELEFENDPWRSSVLSQLQEKKATLVEFGTPEASIAFFALWDDLKPEAAQAVKKIQEAGVEVVMLTGDKSEVANGIAQQAGIQTVKSELQPEDKAEWVRTFQQKGKRVAMVGDGINDAPALALANVGIAMSTGTEVAMESAGITLLKGDIGKIEMAILVSKRVSQTIRQNLFWAFFYNIIAIPIAAGILFPVNGFLLNPMIAGGAMALSSVTVVFNSLRLRATLKSA